MIYDFWSCYSLIHIFMVENKNSKKNNWNALKEKGCRVIVKRKYSFLDFLYTTRNLPRELCPAEI